LLDSGIFTSDDDGLDVKEHEHFSLVWNFLLDRFILETNQLLFFWNFISLGAFVTIFRALVDEI
jgi:hypothetical protein